MPQPNKTVLLLGALFVLSCFNVARAESDFDLFMEKYGIRHPENVREESLILAAVFRDPNAMIGKRVVIIGLLNDIEKVDERKRIYYVKLSVPFSDPPRWDQIAFLSTVDHRPEDFLMCVGVVRGSIRTKGLISGTIHSIPSVREIECAHNSAP